MDEKLERKQARRRIGSMGWVLLIYYAIMNEMVMSVAMIDSIVYLVKYLFQNPMPDYWELYDLVMTRLMDTMTSSGVGYILAILIGTGIILLWKKPRYFKETLLRRNKPMTFGTFMSLLCVFISVQTFAQLFSPLMEYVLNLMGLSAMAALEAATITADTVSMFLYIAFLGPISEEILFRGLILRTLEPYGKRFAILASGLMFGMFHGNIIQTPYAILVGIVLGYVTVEYSIVWAIILHIFNNFVLSDLMGRLYGIAPRAADMLMWVILIGASIATIVLMICRRKTVKEYYTENRHNALATRAMFTSPGILALMVLMLFSIILTVTKL